MVSDTVGETGRVREVDEDKLRDVEGDSDFESVDDMETVGEDEFELDTLSVLEALRV